VVQDAGVSGRLSDRPAVQQVRELAQAGAADAVLLVRVDRMGRENRIILNLLHEFRVLGLRPLFIETPAEDTPVGRFMISVLGAKAELEWEQIREKTSGGRYAKARAGKIPSGTAPLGYHLVSVAEAAAIPEYAGRDGELEIVEQEAEIVRRMYDQLLSGETLRGMLRWLRAEGIRPRRAQHWSASTVRHLLENPVYRGVFFYGATHTRREERTPGKHSFIRTTAESWVEIPVPAILSVETWERAQERLRTLSQVEHGRGSYNWPLRGVLRCGVCRDTKGEPARFCALWATGRHGKRYRYYRCNTAKDLDGCRAQVPALRMEAQALEFVKQAALPGVIAREERARAQERLRESGDVESVLRRVNAELAKLDREERQAAKLIMSGLSPHIVAETVTAIQQRRAALDEEHRRALARCAGLLTPEAAAARGETKADRLREALASSEEEPTRLQRLFQQVLRITVTKGQPPEFRLLDFDPDSLP
jgi:site-specific DNA recombinase